MNYEDYRGRGTHKVTNRDRPVTTLENISEWVQDVYCLEGEDNIYTADKVLGGRDGVSNAPIQALTNRTTYLKDAVVKLTEYIRALQIATQTLLDNVKSVIVSKSAPSDTVHQAWIKVANNVNYTTGFKLVLANGNVISNPIFRVTLENGRVIYIRTDGVNGDLGDIDFNQFEED